MTRLFDCAANIDCRCDINCSSAVMFRSGVVLRGLILSIGAVGVGRVVKAVDRRSCAKKASEAAEVGRSTHLSIEVDSDSAWCTIVASRP